MMKFFQRRTSPEEPTFELQWISMIKRAETQYACKARTLHLMADMQMFHLRNGEPHRAELISEAIVQASAEVQEAHRKLANLQRRAPTNLRRNRRVYCV